MLAFGRTKYFLGDVVLTCENKLGKFDQIKFNFGKIGFIASKDHEIQKIPPKELRYVKYH